MLNHIINFSLNQRIFVSFGLLVLIVTGVISFKNLPVEAFPDVTDIQVNIITLYPGRAAEEVEKQVTIPVEIALAGIPNSIRVFSHTQFGLSFLMVTFNDKATDLVARQQVLERLRKVDLPEGVKPDIAPLSTPIGEIYRFRLKGLGKSSQELRTLQDWVVEKQLRQVPGITDLVTIGGQSKQYEVNPNLAKMRDYKITLAELFTAISRGNSNAGGGRVEEGSQQYLLRSIGLFQSYKDIGSVVVSENAGVPIFVRDVADINISFAPPQGAMAQDEEEDIVVGTILMRKGENPSRVLAAIKEKIEKLNNEILPKGVEIEPYYDRSLLINKTLKTVFINLLEGALLVVAVLYIFLANIRASAIVAVTIPLALLSTFIGLTLVGIPANLLSLGAMDFGIIVDGAVIIVENIFRRLGELNNQQISDPHERKRAIFKATSEVARPTVFSIVIIIAAHIPIFTLERHEGKIFAPMAYTVTSALIGSLLISLILIPMLCHVFLKKDIAHQDTNLIQWCKGKYERLLVLALERKKYVLKLALGLLFATGVVASFLGSEFLPELDEGSMWINVELPASVSIKEARERAAIVRSVITQTPEVKTIISKVGRPDDGTDPKLINQLELLVDLHEERTWRFWYKKADIIAEIESNLKALPGTRFNFSQPVRDNILESISQIDGQIVIKVLGDDLQNNKLIATHILNQITFVEGVKRAFIDRDGELPQFILDIDRKQAARYGLNIGDLQDVIETSLGGRVATELWEGERHFSVVVRLKEAERYLGNLPNTLVATATGAQIPLSEVMNFRTISGSMNIGRENGQRVTSIGIFIQGRDMGSIVKDMKIRVDKNVVVNDARIIWSGEFENQERAMARLSIVIPISILVIFFLLFNAFNSFQSALLIILNIPFAMIGGIFLLFITGTALSVSAAIGFIALFGQAVLNGVILVTYFNQLQIEGFTLREAVIKGSIERLRTVLMTALLAMLGLLPMALSTGTGSETQKPLALVVIGGLVSATLLTLIVLPILYEVF
jgi:cobalt-zinc-cadmium resistance protein CzcA